MSAEDTQPADQGAPGGQGPGGAGGPGASTPQSEDELRAAYEAELSRLTSTDMMAQAVVTLLNIGARRLAPAPGGQPGEPGGGSAQAHPERDLEQARDSIDAVRALLEIIERRIPARELAPLRDALSRLQMAYAQEVGPGAAGAGASAPGAGGQAGSSAPSGAAGSDREAPGDQGQRPPGPGPAESSGRLWVPGR